MKSYEMMKSFNAEQAEQMLEDFEKNEEIYDRHARAIAEEDFDTLEKAGERGLATLGRHLLRLRKELASLSSDERKAPAYGLSENPQQYWMPRNKSSRPSILLDRDDPEAHPLVTPNPDFFQADKSPAAVQSITLINSLWEDFDEKMREEFDWAELRSMLQ